MLSYRDPSDPDYTVTTPIYLGDPKGIPLFMRHTDQGRHVWEDLPATKTVEQIDGKQTEIQMQRCECGGMRARSRDLVRRQTIEPSRN